jgi:hypothetical protein
MHAPNERFALVQFYNGIDTCIHFLDRAAALLPAAASFTREATSLP